MIFKTRKPKRNHHAPGFGPGFLFAKKGAKHRGRARRAAEAQSEARDAKRGGPPKRVRSTEDEDSPERATAVRSPRRKAGQAAKRVRSTEGEHAAQRQRSPKPATQSGRVAQKGAKHRGRARRAAEAQSEACDAKRGRLPKRVRSTEGEHAAQRKRSPKPATQSGAGCKRVRSTEDEHAAQRKRSPKPATRSGAGRKKGAKPVTRRGTGCRRAFYIHFP